MTEQPHIQRRLVFGQDRDPGVIEEIVGRTKSGTLTSNPCVIAYGPGPDGATCSDCVHLFRVSGHYLKCDLRKNTSGPATDHRAGWQACARHEKQA
jgi:hypothetical protein